MVFGIVRKRNYVTFIASHVRSSLRKTALIGTVIAWILESELSPVALLSTLSSNKLFSGFNKMRDL